MGLGSERRLGSVPRHDERRRGSIPHNGGGYGGEKTMKIPPPFDLARVRYCLSSFLSIRFESKLFLLSSGLRSECCCRSNPPKQLRFEVLLLCRSEIDFSFYSF